MCDCYSNIFYLIPTKCKLKTQIKPENNIVHTLVFSKQSGISAKLSNVITLSQRYNAYNVFAYKNEDVMISPGSRAVQCNVSEKKYKQKKKTCGSYDLKMGVRSFDNGFNSIC